MYNLEVACFAVQKKPCFYRARALLRGALVAENFSKKAAILIKPRRNFETFDATIAFLFVTATTDANFLELFKFKRGSGLKAKASPQQALKKRQKSATGLIY